MLAAQVWHAVSDVRRFERAAATPREAQTRRLLAILRRNSASRYGRAHGFALVRSIEDFQRAVPLTDYEDLNPHLRDVWEGRRAVLTVEDPQFFALTSGTTGEPKRVPITPGFLREYRHATACATFYTLRQYPRAGQGRILTLLSPPAIDHSPTGVPCGAFSGYLTQRQWAVFTRRYVTPPAVAAIEDLDDRYYATLRLALADPVSVIIAPSPAAILLLFDKLDAWIEPLIRDVHDGTLSFPGGSGPPMPGTRSSLGRRITADPARASELEWTWRPGASIERTWPSLALIVCWKTGTMALYQDRLRARAGPIPIRELGYMATEARGTVTVAGDLCALAVSAHVFEFIPVDDDGNEVGPPLLCDQLEEGRAYQIILTTSAGLYRYRINDIVRVNGFFRGTPAIEFVRKSRGFASIAGEKLSEQQVTLALSQASRETGFGLRHCTALPRWGNPPHYLLVLEPAADEGATGADAAGGDARAADTFVGVVDQALSRLNIEYRQKRRSGRLGPPVARLAPRGFAETCLKDRVAAGAADGQVKLPVLIADLDKHPMEALIRAIADGRPVAD